MIEEIKKLFLVINNPVFLDVGYYSDGESCPLYKLNED